MVQPLYAVEIGRDTRKALRQFPDADVARLLERAVSLGQDPRPAGCRKLAGKYEGMWRIRVGRYRILYWILDRERLVRIEKIDLRRDAYD